PPLFPYTTLFRSRAPERRTESASAPVRGVPEQRRRPPFAQERILDRQGEELLLLTQASRPMSTPFTGPAGERGFSLCGSRPSVLRVGVGRHGDAERLGIEQPVHGSVDLPGLQVAQVVDDVLLPGEAAA